MSEAPKDADQTQQEKAILRQEYRELWKYTVSHRDEIINHDGMDMYSENVDRQDKLFTEVKGATEYVMDLNQLNLMSDLGVEQARMISEQSKKFTAYDFVNRILNTQRFKANNTGIHWAELGRSTAKYFHVTPMLIDVVGGFGEEPEPVEKAPRKKLNKDITNEEVKQAKQRVRVEDDEKTQTDQRVANALSQLQDLGDVDFFEFCYHPTSFSQTVENVFDASFLIRQNRAKIYPRDDNKSLRLAWENPPTEEQRKDAGRANCQAVVGLDIQGWKKIVENRKLDTPEYPLVGRRVYQ